ncbi:MAG: hypothetical protein D3923_06760 [Candidatus Electrothrix sp. AR3]|nr:hypothetical protein [Candidatus Electrothrix sp. AR3]
MDDYFLQAPLCRANTQIRPYVSAINHRPAFRADTQVYPYNQALERGYYFVKNLLAHCPLKKGCYN